MARFVRYVTPDGRAPAPGPSRSVSYLPNPVNRTNPVNRIPNLVRWSFLLFVFSFPFEATDFGFMHGMLSLAKIFGLLFFAFYAFYFSPVLGKASFPHVPSAMWWFLGYVGVYIMSAARVPSELSGTFLMRIFTLLQILGLFWIASDLLKDQKMVRRVLLTYLLSTTLFAVGIVLRVPGFYQEVTTGRVTGVGENLNLVAMHMAIALLIAIGLILSSVYKERRMKLLLAALTLPVLLAMIATGSRGGIAAFVLGTSVFMLPYWIKKRTLATIGFAALGIIAVVYKIATTPDLLARWQESYYEGKLSDRERIFAAAIQMISERVVFGWGPVEAGYVLGFRVGTWDPYDTHNLLLHLLVEVGIVGAVPFLIALWLCLRKAWQARSGALGLLPLALMGMILIANLSGNNLVWKPQWLVLALATSSAFATSRELARRSAAGLAAYSKTAGDRTRFLARGHLKRPHSAK
jgi:O-antigen ligase